jgi:hypothetical protein
MNNLYRNKRINLIVYEMYTLNEDEIRIIESEIE